MLSRIQARERLSVLTKKFCEHEQLELTLQRDLEREYVKLIELPAETLFHKWKQSNRTGVVFTPWGDKTHRVNRNCQYYDYLSIAVDRMDLFLLIALFNDEEEDHTIYHSKFNCFIEEESDVFSLKQIIEVARDLLDCKMASFAKVLYKSVLQVCGCADFAKELAKYQDKQTESPPAKRSKK